MYNKKKLNVQKVKIDFFPFFWLDVLGVQF
jgi:hypothetical protein